MYCQSSIKFKKNLGNDLSSGNRAIQIVLNVDSLLEKYKLVGLCRAMQVTFMH